MRQNERGVILTVFMKESRRNDSQEVGYSKKDEGIKEYYRRKPYTYILGGGRDLNMMQNNPKFTSCPQLKTGRSWTQIILQNSS